MKAGWVFKRPLCTRGSFHLRLVIVVIQPGAYFQRWPTEKILQYLTQGALKKFGATNEAIFAFILTSERAKSLSFVT